jgi:dTDP-4-dehydrorhamnose 3,5-epimerase-like enzyme
MVQKTIGGIPELVPDCSILSIGTINTKDKAGQYNGYLLTLVNQYEPGTVPIEQVYITVCEPGDVKGPHMHYPPKYDRFYCIEGSAAIVCRSEHTGKISEFVLVAFDKQLLLIPPLNSHSIVALNNQRASILSIPSEGFNPSEPYNQIETKYDGYDWTKWSSL